MGKSLFIAEKPSVAMEFAKALKENMVRHDGYQESDSFVVTWCVGHLVTMSYPEAYDEKYKRWSLQTLPFIPDSFKYEVISDVKKQFGIVKGLLHRKDVDTIYVCTDSGREGEYIYRLVAMMAGVEGKTQKRVWIDSQTEEEILRGIRTAKDLSAYDNLGDAAYLRAKEDYLMGINFSRLLTLKYGSSISGYLGEKYCVISAGRVMTCVLGMIVRREREIRSFVKTPFYRVMARVRTGEGEDEPVFEAEWREAEGSAYFQFPALYRGGLRTASSDTAQTPSQTMGNGFLKKEDAFALIDSLKNCNTAVLEKAEHKTEKKNPPLLYNLAELQNDCSRMFKISPDQTLSIVQELYEKKLVTYPRTDARVLSSAVAKEIHKNIQGLLQLDKAAPYAKEILDQNMYKGIGRTRYVNDKLITDHYAIIPTGQGLGALKSLKGNAYGVYLAVVRRFLCIFYPPAQYKKLSLVLMMTSARDTQERFYASLRVLSEEGWMAVMKKDHESRERENPEQGNDSAPKPDLLNREGRAFAEADDANPRLLQALEHARKGKKLPVEELFVREGETSPPKRYNSGTIILAMENAGSLIEDEELRAQIKGSGIGTSATRAEILKKLIHNKYIYLNAKTQILTPSQKGEMIFDVVLSSIPQLLSPELTASWEKGLTYVTEGSITADEYMDKMKGFIVRRTQGVMGLYNQAQLKTSFDRVAPYYQKNRRRGKQ